MQRPEANVLVELILFFWSKKSWQVQIQGKREGESCRFFSFFSFSSFEVGWFFFFFLLGEGAIDQKEQKKLFFSFFSFFYGGYNGCPLKLENKKEPLDHLNAAGAVKQGGSRGGHEDSWCHKFFLASPHPPIHAFTAGEAESPKKFFTVTTFAHSCTGR